MPKSTWQSELHKELDSVVQGFKEGRKYEQKTLPKVEALLKELKSKGEHDAQGVAHTLIDLKLNYFASKLLGGGYDDQAELTNKTGEGNGHAAGNSTDAGSSAGSTDTKPATAS